MIGIGKKFTYYKAQHQRNSMWNIVQNCINILSSNCHDYNCEMFTKNFLIQSFYVCMCNAYKTHQIIRLQNKMILQTALPHLYFLQLGTSCFTVNVKFSKYWNTLKKLVCRATSHPMPQLQSHGYSFPHREKKLQFLCREMANFINNGNQIIKFISR